MCFKYYKETKKLNITKTQKYVSNLFHKKHNNKKTKKNKKICFDLIDPKMIQKRETYFYTNLGFPVKLFSQFIK